VKASFFLVIEAMQRFGVLPIRKAVLLVFTTASARSVLGGDHPIVGVIDLLRTLSEQVKSEGQAEELVYAKFSTWCSTSISSLDAAILDEKSKIEILDDEVASKKLAEKSLTAQLAKLETEIMRLDAAHANAEKARNDASALFSKADADLASTIAAIDEVLEQMPNSFAQVGQLVERQLVAEALTADELHFLTDRPDVLAKGDFSNHTKPYALKSRSVVELLKELKRKFEDDRTEGTKAETNSQNAFTLSKQARDNAIDVAIAAQEKKGALLSQVNIDLEKAKNDLSETQADLSDDERSLESTHTSCNMKQSEWAERTAIRENEIKALTVGIEILSKATGVRTEPPSNPVLPPSPELRLVQAFPSMEEKRRNLKAAGEKQDPKIRAVTLLRSEAKIDHSRELQKLADEIAAHLNGPFDDVNNMIQKMIFHLMSEQTDEDNHKNWCDLEMNKTNASIDDKSEKIHALDLKIESGKTQVSLLAQEIKDASAFAERLSAHIAEATEIRRVGKEENKAAVKDSQAAQQAIAKATAVIETFYKNTGMVAKEAWELVQEPVVLPSEPSSWGSPYTGVSDPANQPNGIIAVLKKIGEDFAKMEADTLAMEELDQKAFDEEIKTAQIDKARKSKDAEMKTEESKRVLDTIRTQERKKKHLTDELSAVNLYWTDLGPACMDGDSTYVNRKAARDREIAGLKEAQVILANAFTNATNATEASASPPSAAFLAPISASM
jgi:hypothetical protein